ncbi:hypothetical protein [Chromobacterium amazonense]|uniref:Transposase n=1 Tax=Chromobacterium amazonense TaxID=1382803 RepID=A0ABU8V1H3_9NEIS|nr:hypothetical protein [Chromobacterium amazonense]MDQ4541824.1 hypothetical protein [Chromobacterium amazonense]
MHEMPISLQLPPQAWRRIPKKTGAVMKHFLHQFVQLCHLAGRPGLRRLKQR